MHRYTNHRAMTRKHSPQVRQALQMRLQEALRHAGQRDAVVVAEFDDRVAMRVGADQRRQLLDVLNVGEVVELDGIGLPVEVGDPRPGGCSAGTRNCRCRGPTYVTDPVCPLDSVGLVGGARLIWSLAQFRITFVNAPLPSVGDGCEAAGGSVMRVPSSPSLPTFSVPVKLSKVQRRDLKNRTPSCKRFHSRNRFPP